MALCDRNTQSTTATATNIGIIVMTGLISSSLTTYYWTRLAGRSLSCSASFSSSREDNSNDQAISTAAVSLARRALHSVNPLLQKSGLAKVQTREAKPLSPKTPHKTNVVRIALTGGPCGGKSSSLEHIRQEATTKGFDVYTAPEVATLLFNSGIQYPLGQDDQILEFQKSLCRIQLHVERNFTSIIEKTGRPSILIMDRGLLDVKGYIPPSTWNTVLENLDGENKPLTEEYCLGRYCGVVHLVTAADGAPESYKFGTTTDDSGNVVQRRENISEAIDLDVQMRTAWENHPNHYIIHNVKGQTFQDKLNVATSAILSLAEQTHPSTSK